MYIDYKYNNTDHRTNKMKPVDVKSSAYINSDKEINNKDPKFKIDNIVRISKCKSIFAKDYFPNKSKEVFVITKSKNTVMLLLILKAKKLLEQVMKKNCIKQIKRSLELKK